VRGTRGLDLSLAARGKMGFADNPERNEATPCPSNGTRARKRCEASYGL
jgi:hypothetical protein